MIKKKAIIFDVDGLMVDSEPLSHQAWNEFLRPFGHQINDEMVQQMIGFRSDVSTKFVRERFKLPLSIEEIMRQRYAIYDKIQAANGAPSMPGLLALHEVIAQRKIPWGVATSSPHHHAETILRQLQLSPTRDAIAGGDEVAHGKPAPDIYLLAAKRLGIAPQDCMALEDSGPGSRAAVAAGMLTIAIPNGHTKTADFSHVDHQFDSLHQVLERLDDFLI